MATIKELAKQRSSAGKEVKVFLKLIDKIEAEISKKKLIKTKINPKQLLADQRLAKYKYYKTGTKLPRNEKWVDTEYLYKKSKTNKTYKKMLKILSKMFADDHYKEGYGFGKAGIGGGEIKKFGETEDYVVRKISSDLMEGSRASDISPDILLKVLASYNIGYYDFNLNEQNAIDNVINLFSTAGAPLSGVRVSGFKKMLKAMHETYNDEVLPICAYEDNKIYIPPVNRKRSEWNGFILNSITYLMPKFYNVYRDPKTNKLMRDITFSKVIHNCGDTGEFSNRTGSGGGGSTVKLNTVLDNSKNAPAGLAYIIFDDSGKELAIAFSKKPKMALTGAIFKKDGKKRKQIGYGFKF